MVSTLSKPKVAVQPAQSSRRAHVRNHNARVHPVAAGGARLPGVAAELLAAREALVAEAEHALRGRCGPVAVPVPGIGRPGGAATVGGGGGRRGDVKERLGWLAAIDVVVDVGLTAV